ncbi:hypothetical protein GCM10011579_094130 [Streptomyces albiflavescens]|uniref:IPT/TIG domain-containing protein n=1 Tax=Streptomyces albiflavescens TaxID=1623582 RepID=A0A917YFP8_9ACTN|nr:hypothetical protein [Streptomyces albiflavescens]GGN94538.1 hypothetical protein GCM10011579_094130 [Streptomyces albiflavescens]
MHSAPGPVSQRPRYFPRQVVTPTELNLANQYFMDRMRRHNRMMHGWGVVCGALVCRAAVADGSGPEPWKIAISAGYLLDPQGNEIAIEEHRVVDVRTEGITVMPDDPTGEIDDPWCADAPPVSRTGKQWVAVRYEEGLTRPVRIEPSGCGCSGTACEYSRWHDGYRVGFLSDCPPSHRGDPPLPDEITTGHGPAVACPTDDPGPWVVLAVLDIASDGTITSIDNGSCRRMAPSLAAHWWRCVPATLTVDTVSTTPAGSHAPGASAIKLTVAGSGFRPGVKASLGPGIRISALKAAPDGTSLTMTVRVNTSAQQGDRTLSVTNPDGSEATASNAFTVA